MARPTERRQLTLELGYLGPHDELTVLKNARDGAVDFGANPLPLNFEVDERYLA
jgi:hypothetical protein